MCEQTETTAPELLPPLNLADLEQRAIEEALARCDGNRTQAAKLLGIAVRTLQRKIKRLGLPDADAATCQTTRK